MKKVFTLMIAFLAFTFCAKAQYLLQEGFDTGVLPTGWTVVDADGDGYNWDAEYPYEGGFDTQAGDGCISSASYLNSYGALHPDNWLITPALVIPATTDHVELTFYVMGQDANDYAEKYGVYVSPTTALTDFTSVHQGTTTDEYVEVNIDLTEYTGQTIYIAFRHYDITDMYWLNLDEVSVFADPTDATISALPLSIAFGRTLIGETSNAQEINVIGYSITGDITATTDAPFAISADGTTYGTTATIASNGGTLYVNFTPEIEDSVNGIITLSATDATDVTIDLMGSGKDCSTAISEFPYTPNFANGIAGDCWSVNSTTEETWETYTYNGTTYLSCTGLAETEQDEEVISAKLDFSAHTELIYMDIEFLASYYWATCTGEDSLTTFTLYASTDGGNTWGANPIWNILDHGEFSNYAATNTTIDLSSLAGESNVKLKFKYEGALNSSQVLFGKVNIYTFDEPFVEANRDSLSFIAVLGNTAEDMVIVNFLLADEATATTEAPFAVSVDGVNFANTATIANNGDTLYIQYNPTEAGNDNGNVTLSVTDGEDFIIGLTGRAIDCSSEGTVPFTETFEYAGELPTCWSFVYGDNDPSINTIQSYNDANGDGYTIRFSSLSRTSPYTQYMISPALTYTGTADMEVSFDARAYNSYPEVFAIGYSTTSNDTADFIWGNEYTTTNSAYNSYFMNVPANAQYVAIRYSSNYQYYLYVDNFSVKEAEPIIRVNVDTIDFGTIYLGNTSDQIAIATGAMLNEDITVSTNAPFLVSADNETFATTATLPSAGDTLYVRFEPTAEGDFVDIVTLSADGIDTTFAVKGTGYDCSGTISVLPYTEAFGEELPPMCWTIGEIDNMTNGTIDEEETDYVVAFAAPTYIATPEIEVNDNDMWIIFDYATNDAAATNDCPDAFRVGYSSTDNSYESFTWGETTTIDYDMTDFEEFRTVVPAGTKYVAIEATEIGSYLYFGFFEMINYLLIDNFTIKVLEPEIYAANTSINFGAVEIGNTSNRTVEILGTLLTEPIVATTAAPYAVSIDGNNFATTVTMDAAGGTLYIQYAPTAEATDNGTVVLTSDTLSTTINVTGNGIDCQPISTLPWVEDFEGGVFVPECWSLESQNEETWESTTDDEGNTWAYITYGETLQDEDLITPTFDFSNYSGRDLKLSFTFNTSYTYLTEDDPEEQFNVLVYVSTDGGNTFPSTPIYNMRNDQPEFADFENSEAEISLASVAGQSNVKIKFNYYGTYGADFAMDNVTIEDGTGIVENVNNSVSIYPNPANTTLNVTASSNINTVEVYNLTGSKIATINGNGTNAQINVANYANGMYFVKIITNDGTTTKKFNVAR